jgi:hypothetical protein
LSQRSVRCGRQSGRYGSGRSDWNGGAGWSGGAAGERLERQGSQERRITGTQLLERGDDNLDAVREHYRVAA